MTQTAAHDPSNTIATGLKACCPRCGQASMFKGWLTLREHCPACELDYGFADPADGPAFFVMSGVGVVGMAAFMAFEFMVQPPVWVHFVTSLPLLTLACILVLRPFKAWMVAEQYVHSAEEATFQAASSTQDRRSKDASGEDGAGG